MNIFSIVFLCIAVLSVIFFHSDIYFPIWFSVVLMVFVSIYFLKQYQRKRVGMLILLLWLVYALPFIHIPPYIWFDFNSQPVMLWGLVVNPYMLDEQIIKLTAMLGATGGIGIAFGSSLSNKPIKQDLGLTEKEENRKFKTMSTHIWLIWIIIGVILSAIAAPEDTILKSAYTESKSISDQINFSSAWMISYIILGFTFCDALLEQRHFIKSLKMKIMIFVIILIVVYFQLLRGDRESIPWVFALGMANYYWASGITQRRGFSIPWLKIFFLMISLVVISMIIGAIRSMVVGMSISEIVKIIHDLRESKVIGLSNILHGTWSAVLLTPLSVAGDHIYDLLNFKLGEDYVNFLLSIIPGFLADMIGYVRPIDSFHGPAWEMRYGLGGTHAVVVPFMNFSMMGVFIIPAIWSGLLTLYEKKVLKRVSVIKLSFLVTITTVLPHWLWYGEKNILNGLIIWIIFCYIYRLSLGFSQTRSVSKVHNIGSDNNII